MSGTDKGEEPGRGEKVLMREVLEKGTPRSYEANSEILGEPQVWALRPHP